MTNRTMDRELHYGKRLLGDGIYVSNDTWQTGMNNNDLVIGATGSGKTLSYTCPNLRLENYCSYLVADTKGQLSRIFSEEYRRRGYEVYSIDLANPIESECGYNPIRFIRKTSEGRYYEQDILTVANGVYGRKPNEREPFWDNAAISHIAFLIAYMLERLDEKEHNLITVGKLQQMFLKNKTSFGIWVTDHMETFAAKKYNESMALAGADRTFASVMSFVNLALTPMIFRESERVLNSKKSVDLAELGQKKMIIFLNQSDTNSYFAPLATLFYTQTLQVLTAQADAGTGQLKIPVRLFMDDFYNCQVPEFDKMISVIRSRDISVSVNVQSLSQLENLYGRGKAQTIIDNCANIIFLGGCQSRETAEFIGLRAQRTPENIMCMPKEKEYILTAGMPPKLVDKIRPYMI